MDAKEIKLLLDRLREGIGQKAVALRCDCENLETVYIRIKDTDDVCVTDDHRTFQYLDRGSDSTYIPLESLDLSSVQSICDSLSIDFKPAPEDGFPSLECCPDPDESIAGVVERVAEAVDQVFKLAMRPELQ
jgi:hypothetical protein